MKYKKMIWPVVGLLGLGLMAAAYVYMNRPLEVIGGPPVKMAIEDKVVETGTIAYEKTQTVYAERSGKVVSLSKEVGQSVEMGERIVQFDDQGLKLQLKDAEAKVSSAKAQLEGIKLSNYADQLDQISLQIVESKRQLELAVTHRKEMEELFLSGAVSESEVKAAKDQTALLQSQLNQQSLSRVQLEKGSPSYQKKLSQSQLEQAIAYRDQVHYEVSLMNAFAPIKGILLEKWVEPGAFVSAGSPLFKIGDTRQVKVEVDILSDEVDGLTLGDSVVMTANYLPNRLVEGKVIKIAPMAKETVSSLGISQKRLSVTIGVTSHQTELIPNMPMDVEIIKDTKQEALCLPITAIREDKDGVYVYGVEQGIAKRIDIQLGIQSGEWQEILKGLTPETLVISELGTDIRFGDKVSLKMGKGQLKNGK